MKTLVAVLAIVLAILHQDFWWWDDPTLVAGIMPIGLAWHLLYSCLAAGLWAFAVKFAWPSEWEAYAEAGPSPDGGASGSEAKGSGHA